MSGIHYLAYGSNLHPLRLLARAPSSRVIGVVPLPGRCVSFHKRSNDGSGKCNLPESSYADVSYGVIYELSIADKKNLDIAEGLGRGYDEALLSVSLNDATYRPIVYIAASSHIDAALQPYHWYKAFVLAGARHHNLPDDYIRSIESQPSVPDPDAGRNAENLALLARMLKFHG